jgi:hypothetical protein
MTTDKPTLEPIAEPEAGLPGASPAPAEPKRLRRAYERPRLEVLGDYRDETMGGSPGIGDSVPPANTLP